jgi:drug/metabolite transporter (DMT)-like permease
MSADNSKAPGLFLVLTAFAIIYIVWGSTYFFIHIAIKDFSPFILGAMRFILAGSIMILWCLYKREKVFDWHVIKHAAVSGLFLLFVGNGVVIWAEQTQPSALVAILVSGAPIWFVLLDRPNWKINFKNLSVIIGLITGFGGVIMLFYEKTQHLISTKGNYTELGVLVLLIIGSMSWAIGSIYSKKHSSGKNTAVNTAWQMLIAGVAFIPLCLINGEIKTFSIQEISFTSWMAALYLVIFGSLIAFSAYIWLLKVRPAAQVSTYAYVNPVVAVLLGVFFANEKITLIQYSGLAIILTSVLLINLARYKRQ